MNEEGDTIVIRANVDKFEQIARNSVGETIIASPAISQGNLFLRTKQRLFCF